MSKVVQISILGRISGNVNADEVIGNRTTLKKMYSSDGDVLPFVSARAVKHSIRRALEQKGFKIDPFIKDGANMKDSGNPKDYIDNDLFGYMTTKKKDNKTGEPGGSVNRQAPIALSYFKAMYDTSITTEFGARFPRQLEQSNPVPFEIEVAEFIGKLNTIIYDYVGKVSDEKEVKFEISPEERVKRLDAFLNILLSPSYVLPRRTNSLNIPEYLAAVVVLSDAGPKPIYQYLDYSMKERKIIINNEKISHLLNINGKGKVLGVNYGNATYPEKLDILSVDEMINQIVTFMK